MNDKNPNKTNISENHDDCKNQREETKAEKTKDENVLNNEKTREKSTTSMNHGGSCQISSISLKMIADCVNLVVDQSHIQLSSIIHISKRDNQLNIEHKMMESTPNVREGSSESAEENVINKNSFYNNVASGSTSIKPVKNVDIHHEHVIIHQPTASSSYNQNPHLLSSVTSAVNTRSSGAGTSSTNSGSDNRSNLATVTTENITRNVPPPYTKNPGHSGSHKRQSTKQIFNQLYGISPNTQVPAGPHLSRQQQGTSSISPQSTGPRMFQHGVMGIPPLHGAPPTYSAVMRIDPPNNRTDPSDWTHQTHTNSRLFNSLFRRPEVCLQPSAPFIAPPRPPPSYAEVQGVNVMRTPIDLADIAQDIHWGPTPMSVHCPNCGNIVTTVVRLHRSNLTHFSALTLCLCGCWPCCLLPYCMKTCKTTYHECPICFTVIGMFTPW